MNLLTCTMAAKTLNIAETTLQRYAKEGQIPAQRLGQKWIFREEDLPQIREVYRTNLKTRGKNGATAIKTHKASLDLRLERIEHTLTELLNVLTAPSQTRA